MEFLFCFCIFISGTQKALPNIFFQNVLFLVPDFHFQNKKYFRNFKIVLGAGSKILGVGKNLSKDIHTSPIPL